MRVIVATEFRYYKLPRGEIVSHGTGAYQFFTRYLEVFDEVVVLGRVGDQRNVPFGLQRAEGPGVRFFAMPHYIGSLGYLRCLLCLRRRAREAARLEGAFILRVGGAIANLVATELRRLGKCFSLEVVGDPYDSLAYRSLKSPWSFIARPWAVRHLRKQCTEAQCVAYVTCRTLQRRYPAAEGRLTTHYSSIDLPAAAFATFKNSGGITGRAPRGSRRRLVFVGSLAQLYKAPDVLISALVRCVRRGLDAELTIIGDGKCRRKLERQANTLGLADRVRFVGEIPSGEPVYQWLRRADLFVLPSLMEGLPRAMIEAMACGVPCIGSTIGGIPELLPAEDMVPLGDSRALAKKIIEVLTDPARMHRMVRRNREKAKEYRWDVLRGRRIEFYRAVKEAAESHRARGS